MSNKGIIQTLPTRQKISMEKTKDRAELLKSIEQYILTLTKEDIPSITRCAIYAGIGEKALLSYEARTEENSDIRILLDFVRDIAKASLMEGGLKKSFDSRMASFLLQAGHGMRNDTPSLTQNNIFTGLSPELLAEALELSRQKPALSKK